MPGKISTVIAISAVLAAAQVAARPTYPARIPNGANVVGVDALGHVDTSGGGARNAFGTAFASADLAWTKELCEADSDGDGQTNGQELGDPCCEWSTGGTPRWTTGVSHPGDATSTSDASLWSSVTCGSTTATTAPTTATTAPSTSTTTTMTTTAPSTSTTTTTAAPSVTTTPAPTTSGTVSSASLAAISATVAATALAAIFA